MAKPSSAGKITIPASTRRLRSAAHQEGEDVPVTGVAGENADVTEDITADIPDDDGDGAGNVKENGPVSPSSGAMPVAPEAEHRYNTRPTNDPHPARTARLARRSHAEVREDLEEEIRKQKAALDAQKEEYQRRSDELAELEEDMDLQAAEDSIENVLERESQMILEDEATFKAAAGAMGLVDGSKHLVLWCKQSSPSRCRNGLLDNEDDVAMIDAMSNKSDLSESDSDVHPGSKRKARKQSAKVGKSITHHAPF